MLGQAEIGCRGTGCSSVAVEEARRNRRRWSTLDSDARLETHDAAPEPPRHEHASRCVSRGQSPALTHANFSGANLSLSNAQTVWSLGDVSHCSQTKRMLANRSISTSSPQLFVAIQPVHHACPSSPIPTCCAALGGGSGALETSRLGLCSCAGSAEDRLASQSSPAFPELEKSCMASR